MQVSQLCRWIRVDMIIRRASLVEHGDVQDRDDRLGRCERGELRVGGLWWAMALARL